MATATQAQNAIMQLIVQMAGSPVPQTTLTAQATAGATTFTAASATAFVPGGTVLFNDQLGESLQTVLSVSGNVVTLDFTGLTPGLEKTHTNGTLVYTNCMTEAPLEISVMLALGSPFIFVTTLDEQERRRTMGAGGHTQSVYTVHVQYHRTLIRPDDQLMAPNRWASDQQKAARADLDSISTTLKANPSLLGTAVTLGDMGGGSTKILTRSWRKLTASTDTQQFAAGMDVIVTGSYA